MFNLNIEQYAEVMMEGFIAQPLHNKLVAPQIEHEENKSVSLFSFEYPFPCCESSHVTKDFTSCK